ncbi:MAG: hypothetical protein HY814_13140 [Candidatus Riflebacteria bacterium]|nr:hypothetical protein [Candidatus Riflebacteria bacterium]
MFSVSSGIRLRAHARRIALLQILVSLVLSTVAHAAPGTAGSTDGVGPDLVSVVCIDEMSSHLRNVDRKLAEEMGDSDRRAYLLFGPSGVLESSRPAAFTKANSVDLWILAWKARKAAYRIDFESAAGLESRKPEPQARAVGPASLPALTRRQPGQYAMSPCMVPGPAPSQAASPAATSEDGLCLLHWTRGPFQAGHLGLRVTAPADRATGPAAVHRYSIPVETTSRSMVRLAVLGSDLQQQRFTVNGGLVNKEFTSNPVNPATVFVWSLDSAGFPADSLPRDFRHRINPMVGLPFDRLFKRWYAGLDFMAAKGLHVDAGLQLEGIRELTATSALLDVDGGVQPRTVERWRSAPFIGVSVDAQRLVDRIGRWLGN